MNSVKLFDVNAVPLSEINSVGFPKVANKFSKCVIDSFNPVDFIANNQVKRVKASIINMCL